MQSIALAPLPGVAEWVERLQNEGWRQAVGSSAPRRNVEAVHEALNLSWTTYKRRPRRKTRGTGKPEPEVFALAATRVGAPPDKCVAVEDAAAGIEAAARAGMRSIGVGRGNASLRADATAARLSDLPLDAFRKLLDDAGAC